jgi:uncharacterized membrane protein
MTKRLILAVALGLSSVVLAVPMQNTATLPWWTSPVVGDIGLSQEQQHKIRIIIRSYRNRLFDARNNAQKAEAEVRDLLNEPTISLAEAKPTIDRLAQARAESTRLFTEMSVEVRSVLTQDQWRQLIKKWGEIQRTKPNHDTDLAP